MVVWPLYGMASAAAIGFAALSPHRDRHHAKTMAIAVGSVNATTTADTYVTAQRALFEASVGDKIEVFAIQDSGQSLNMLNYNEVNKLIIKRIM